MKIPCVEGEAIPTGDYVGRFLGIEMQDYDTWEKAQFKGKDGQVLPQGIMWSWEVVGGPHAGRVADRLTPPVATKGNVTTRFAEVITGGRFKVGAEFDPAAQVGTLWRFRVDTKDGGRGTYVSDRGLSRAFDLEKEADPAAVIDRPPATGGQSETFVYLIGAKQAAALTQGALLVGIKSGTLPGDLKAGNPGDASWRTLREVVPHLFDRANRELGKTV